MKTYLFICTFLSSIACKTISGNSVPSAGQSTETIIGGTVKDTLITDTLTYLQSEFVDKKEKYIGKEFSFLINDLKIDIKSYLRGISARNKYIIPDISISFYGYDEGNYKEAVLKQRIARLWIKWETPLPADSVAAIIQQTNNIKKEWRQPEQQYYGRQIVKDLGLDR